MKTLMVFLIVIIGPFIKFGKNDAGVEPYSATGHDQFSELSMSSPSKQTLSQMADSYIDKELKNLKKKFFGTSQKNINLYQDGTYVSYTLFSRSNKTREEYTFVYDINTVKYYDVSVTVKGSISAKAAYKGKKAEISGNGEVVKTTSTDSYTKDTETNKMSVVVYPGYKVTLRIVGECKISNGVSKECRFGIAFKKGAWEVVDITSVCYELFEEKL